MIKAEYQENVWDDDDKIYVNLLVLSNDDHFIALNTKGFSKNQLTLAIVQGITELGKYE